MSVIKSKRNESDMQFLNTARELEIYTLRQSKNFPKRYSLFFDLHLLHPAVQVYEYVKEGNSIDHPLCQEEANIRREHFLKAYAKLQSLTSQIEIAHEAFQLNFDSMRRWMDLVDQEMRLVKAVMKADRARYKNLP